MAPSQGNVKNEADIRNNVFSLTMTEKFNFKYKIGDKVRLNKVKRFFEKGYTPN